MDQVPDEKQRPVQLHKPKENPRNKAFIQQVRESVVSASALIIQQLKEAILRSVPSQQDRDDEWTKPFCPDSMKALMKVAKVIENFPQLNIFETPVCELSEQFGMCLVKHNLQRRMSKDPTSKGPVAILWDAYVDHVHNQILSEQDAEEYTRQLMKLTAERFREVENRRTQIRNKGSIRAFNPDALPGGSDTRSAPTLRLMQRAEEKAHQSDKNKIGSEEKEIRELLWTSDEAETMTMRRQMTISDLKLCVQFRKEWEDFQRFLFHHNEASLTAYMYVSEDDPFTRHMSSLRLVDLTDPSRNMYWTKVDKSEIERGIVSWPHLGITACSMDSAVFQRMRKLLRTMNPEGIPRSAVQKAHRQAEQQWMSMVDACCSTQTAFQHAVHLVKEYSRQSFQDSIRRTITFLQDTDRYLESTSFIWDECTKPSVAAHLNWSLLQDEFQICFQLEKKQNENQVPEPVQQYIASLEKEYSPARLHEWFLRYRPSERKSAHRNTAIKPKMAAKHLPPFTTTMSNLARAEWLEPTKIKELLQDTVKTFLKLYCVNFIYAWSGLHVSLRHIAMVADIVSTATSEATETQSQKDADDEMDHSLDQTLQEEGFGTDMKHRMQIFASNHPNRLQLEAAYTKRKALLQKVQLAWVRRLREMAMLAVATQGMTAQEVVDTCRQCVHARNQEIQAWIKDVGRPLLMFMPACRTQYTKWLDRYVATSTSPPVDDPQIQMQDVQVDPRPVLLTLVERCGAAWQYKVDWCTSRLRVLKMEQPVWMKPQKVEQQLNKAAIKQYKHMNMDRAIEAIRAYTVSWIATDILHDVLLLA